MGFRKLVFVTALLALGGCGLTSEGDRLQAAIKEKGARVADTLLENADQLRCEGATIGAVMRKYNTVEKFKMYLASCSPEYQ